MISLKLEVILIVIIVEILVLILIEAVIQILILIVVAVELAAVQIVAVETMIFVIHNVLHMLRIMVAMEMKKVILMMIEDGAQWMRINNRKKNDEKVKRKNM